MSGSKIIKREQVDQNVSLGARLDLNESNVGAVASSDNKVVRAQDAEKLKQAQDIIEKAKQDASFIKRKAKELYLQVEEKSELAKKEGFEKGRQEGLSQVTEQLMLIQQKNQKLLKHIEKESLSLVYEIANRLIGDALKNSDDAIVGLVRQALQSSMGNELTLFVNPDDFEKIKQHEHKLLSTLHTAQSMSIKPSERVKSGGCMVESELGTIDAQLDWQLEAIRKALGLESGVE